MHASARPERAAFNLGDATIVSAPLNPLLEAARKSGPAMVTETPLFGSKPAHEAYPEGTEVDFGEIAPVDLSGIPDLFDPAAVTGDGI